MKVKCLKCKYEWNTISEKYLVSCPSCNNKVRIRTIPGISDAFKEGDDKDAE